MACLRIIALTLLASSGCAHHHLRYNTKHSAQSVAEVHTQQVLDNLAKFAHNCDSLPYFSVASGAATEINTGLDASGPDLDWKSFTLTSWGIGTGASRDDKMSYTLTPITDTRKLELMRCAYQKVLTGSCGCVQSGRCPDCEKRFSEFYLGNTRPGKTPELTVDGKPKFLLLKNEGQLNKQEPEGTVLVASTNKLNQTVFLDENQKERKISKDEEKLLKPLFIDNSVFEHTNRTGRVTADCLSSGWIRVGDRKDFKKHPCCLVGHYCGTYVGVPDCHRNELTKLTLVVLDIATHEAAKPDDSDGTAGKPKQTSGLLANLSQTYMDYMYAPSQPARTPDDTSQIELQRSRIERMLQPPRQPLSPIPGSDLLLRDQYFRALTPNQ